MSYPITTTATTTEFSTSVTVMAVNLPASILSGDLLIAWSSVRNAGTWTVPTNWVELDSQSSGGVGELTVFYKIADGTEGATATWTAGTGTTAEWHVRKITNWHGTTPPEVTKSTSGGNPNTNPNPPSLTPSWGADDILWFAVEQSSAEDITSVSSYPTNYTGGVYSNLSAGGSSVSLATAYRQLNAASDDPGVYTMSAQPRWWDCMTVAVRPSSAGSLVNVSDTVTLSEIVSARPTIQPSVSDTATLSEEINANLRSFIDVSESITVTDTISVVLASIVSISDTVTASEEASVDIPINISVAETNTLSESIGTTLASLLDVSDSAALSESVEANLRSLAEVSDTVTVSESVGANIPLNVSVSETATISETIGVTLVSLLDVSDSAALSESVEAKIDVNVNASETVTVTESVEAKVGINASVSDTATLSESVTVELETALTVSVSDTVTISESVGRTLISLISVSDTLGRYPKIIFVDGEMAIQLSGIHYTKI